MDLASDYFASGATTEEYRMIVMEHRESEVVSFAIDEFPLMNEAAMEEFWIRVYLSLPSTPALLTRLKWIDGGRKETETKRVAEQTEN